MKDLWLRSQMKTCTGKSLSEALVFESTNPQYDDKLFIELQVHYMQIASSEHLLQMFWACNLHVLNLKFNEQSVVILWVSWGKNTCFWKRFTCTVLERIIFKLCFKDIIIVFQLWEKTKLLMWLMCIRKKLLWWM